MFKIAEDSKNLRALMIVRSRLVTRDRYHALEVQAARSRRDLSNPKSFAWCADRVDKKGSAQ
jgi:hypothetical protein